MGKLLVLGKDIDAYSDKELSTTIGVVLTDKCEIRNMLVRELVGMGRSPYTGFWGKLSKMISGSWKNPSPLSALRN